ncbi:MAG: transposase, partial [Actinobacteria bacterium]|nr:transposase [Actinomycetota bacterium]
LQDLGSQAVGQPSSRRPRSSPGSSPSPDGAAAFAKRGITVEPVFGNLKANLGYRRFSRRGFSAVASEWRLISTAHNLLKLHRHQPAMG